eukprot:jgi/Tetstr1/446749/TSEL_034236.t1
MSGRATLSPTSIELSESGQAPPGWHAAAVSAPDEPIGITGGGLEPRDNTTPDDENVGLLVDGRRAAAPRTWQRRLLRCAGDVAAPSGLQLSLLVHVLWGFHPIFGRFLQVTSRTPMDGLVLGCTGNATSGMLIWVAEWVIVRMRQQRQGSGGNSSREQPPPVREWSRRAWGFAALFGVVTTMRVGLNILSLKYTQAYNTQLIQSLSPIVTALAEAAVMRTQLPATLWPALVLMLAGMTLVGLGQSPLLNPEHASIGWSDLVGAGLQFASTLFSAAARLCMAMTKDIIRKTDLVQVQNISNTVLLAAVTLLHRPQDWLVFGRMTAASWGAFLGMIVVVYCVAKYYQVTVIREIGPGMHTSLQPARVLVAVAGSAWLLGEPVTSAWEWAGIVLTSATLTGWLLHVTALERASNR